ncbi:LacI family transcriptional regulator [Actinoallomurus iriomotensis]|uniref:LacI family transcriptional regulator n=1 Tax=Actinoallomurus iriomotensis TaxID=478107 RepID=A0A9W6W0E5_9ACTN|nr:LacI family transcriptional regulator [Actinoallomurus iriomotensis]
MVKISDVARHAGVSPSTVSYVLSGKRSISEETRRRVLDSVRTLGYRPHAGARALASSRSNVIALVVPLRSGIHVPVVMQMAIASVTTARTHDHDVLLLTQDEGVGGLERVAGTALVDAIIVMDVELHDVRLPVLRSLGRPSVLIGFPADPTGLTCIDLNFEAAGAACAEHLADLGHREIALIGAPPAVYERGTGFAERTRAGFQRAAAERGVHAVVRPCDPQDARSTAAGLLHDHPDLTGVVIHNEPATEPLLTAFRAAGRHVPDDLSVLAIAPDDLAERLGLTSIAIPADELGAQAVTLLMAKLDGREVPAATLLPPRLVVRQSTPPLP